jgi:Flp pilus assembly protein TadG
MKRGIRSFEQSHGQAMVEYVIVALVLIGALFTPASMFNGETGAQFLADMIKAFFKDLTFFLSLP